MKKKSAIYWLMVLTVFISVFPQAHATVVDDWQQLPDLNPSGLDIFANSPKVLADDFLCIESGPVTDIHLWGGWFNGYLPETVDNSEGSASNVGFTLSIRADIPAEAEGYSKPGALLWQQSFEPGQFTTGLYYEGSQGFFNPNTGQFVRYNQVWQYDFYIDEELAFLQQGSSGNPIVYWLDVSANPTDQQAFFGWRTSADVWNDSAVWDNHPLDGNWGQLEYPSGHPYAGEVQLDMAFAITTEIPEPATLLLLGFGAVMLKRRR